jgi:DNA invertase Pin-like site-specific DNA recombinase
VDFYTNLINSREDWTMVEVYTDEGLLGLSTKRRDGFNRMIADALAGRIDLIVTNAVITKGQFLRLKKSADALF